MAYTNRTVDYAYNLLINAFQEKFNNSLRLLPKSFINILSKVLAGIFVIPYKLAGWYYLQLFPETASFEKVNVLGHTMRPLVQLGKLFGVGEPESGTAWSGKIKVEVVQKGKTLGIGTQLSSEKTGLIYNIAENIALTGDEAEASVYCTTSGAAGNLDEGDTLSFVSPLSFVETDATVTEMTRAGTEDESEADYRARVKTGYGAQVQGGSLTDYRTWAFDAAGVLQTYIYNDNATPAGVIIYVAGDPEIYEDRIADRALCVAVGKACTYDPDTGKANRKPLTAVLDPAGDETYKNIKSVIVTPVDVYITDMTDALEEDFGASATAELSSYLKDREPIIRGLDDEDNRKDIVTRNSLAAVVNSVATALKASFGDVTMRVDGNTCASYTLGAGELCRLGDLYINGAKYEE